MLNRCLGHFLTGDYSQLLQSRNPLKSQHRWLYFTATISSSVVTTPCCLLPVHYAPSPKTTLASAKLMVALPACSSPPLQACLFADRQTSLRYIQKSPPRSNKLPISSKREVLMMLLSNNVWNHLQTARQGCIRGCPWDFAFQILTNRAKLSILLSQRILNWNLYYFYLSSTVY